MIHTIVLKKNRTNIQDTNPQYSFWFIKTYDRGHELLSYEKVVIICLKLLISCDLLGHKKVRNSRYIIHIILKLYRSLKMYLFKRYFRTHTKQYCLYSFTHQKKKVYLKNKSRTKHIQKLTFREICGIIHPCHGTYLNKLLIYTYIIFMGYRKGNSCFFLSIYRFVSCFFSFNLSVCLFDLNCFNQNMCSF